MQALASDQAFNMLAEVDQKAEYWKANGRKYWREIITEEKKRKERYLGTLGVSG
jgi:galactose-1-phosphate uridylyltransferase